MSGGFAASSLFVKERILCSDGHTSHLMHRDELATTALWDVSFNCNKQNVADRYAG